MKDVDYDYELSNGWGRWENLVLSGLKELKDNQKALADKVDGVASRVLVIETRGQDKTANRTGTRAWVAIAISGLAALTALAATIYTLAS